MFLSVKLGGYDLFHTANFSTFPTHVTFKSKSKARLEYLLQNFLPGKGQPSSLNFNRLFTLIYLDL